MTPTSACIWHFRRQLTLWTICKKNPYISSNRMVAHKIQIGRITIGFSKGILCIKIAILTVTDEEEPQTRFINKKIAISCNLEVRQTQNQLISIKSDLNWNWRKRVKANFVLDEVPITYIYLVTFSGGEIWGVLTLKWRPEQTLVYEVPKCQPESKWDPGKKRM